MNYEEEGIRPEYLAESKSVPLVDLGGRPDRDTVISKDDNINLRIALENNEI